MNKTNVLLQHMRQTFLNEMGERCDRLDQKALQLGKPSNVAIDKVLPRGKQLTVEVLQTLTGLTVSQSEI
ncbi:hypothetical protein [Desulfonatronum sp. SC1]|uniref:hypothetical protein n=1 Tax=Desulfonatronum sp. SC1 TaxID=2109626 RepID=UPI000D2FA9BD|nr:hypothetical protein [Desulfonatronum sp. SC1]PTN39029.1 hypothetical protein C6366_00925 [Desulfonatronum sp. SC1]